MIYIVYLVSAAMQLAVVMFLAAIDATTLGIYSLMTAIMAVSFQVVQFEGHQYAIARIISTAQLERMYRTTNLLWLALGGLLVFLSHTDPVATVFVASFMTVLSGNWIANFRRIDARIEGNDRPFRRDMLLKMLFGDIMLPTTLMGSIWLFGDRVAGALSVVVFLLNVLLLLWFIGLPRSIKDLQLPRHSFLHGVIIKRLDSMFIRLFSGLVFGPEALGRVQPLLSWGRLVTLLTPLWINLNFSGHLRRAGRSVRAMRKVFLAVTGSYVLYVAAAVALWQAAQWSGFGDYAFWQVLLVMLFFGNQNSKALFRSFSIIQDDLHRNNMLLSVGFVLKVLMCLALASWGAFGTIAIALLMDSILIGFNILMTRVHGSGS